MQMKEHWTHDPECVGKPDMPCPFLLISGCTAETSVIFSVPELPLISLSRGYNHYYGHYGPRPGVFADTAEEVLDLLAEQIANDKEAPAAPTETGEAGEPLTQRKDTRWKLFCQSKNCPQ